MIAVREDVHLLIRRLLRARVWYIRQFRVPRQQARAQRQGQKRRQ